MRFPKLADLDRDQLAIFQGAPTDRTVLIVGPPGTGKTVIAFHRAHVLQKTGRSPRVFMYNKVLRSYAGKRGGVADDVPVTTMHSWASAWWRTMFQSNPPSLDTQYELDWAGITDRVVPEAATPEGARQVAGLWGHLIIDEGQDFPREMYLFLHMTMAVANDSGANPPLAVTVLADENQRLAPDRNSTLKEIQEALGLHPDDRTVFRLTKNYRNTKQIAMFANCFYVGLPSAKADLPTRTSEDLPVVSLVRRDSHREFLEACADKIARYVKARRTEEVAVFVNADRDREAILRALESRLAKTRIEVQSYSSKQGRNVSLSFDTPGHVTVLNRQSGKGLEFDAAFVVDPGAIAAHGGSTEIDMKMALYVLCSRPRTYLEVMLKDGPTKDSILKLLPAELFTQETL